MKRPYLFHLVLISVVTSTLVMLHACKKLEYSPFQSDGPERPEDLNNMNIRKLLESEGDDDDTVTVLHISDTHRFYNELEHLVTQANKRTDIDFVSVAGDISDFGLLEQFMHIEKILSRLKVPHICAIGNHDLTSNGSDIYLRMYGEKNFSFTYRGYKFLYHDTNGREYNFEGNVPNMWWLESELNDTVPKWFVGVSHVPPFDNDFDNSLEFPYRDLLASHSKFALSLHGHLHGQYDGYKYGDSVRYIVSNSVDKQKSTLIKFINGKVIKEMLPY